jgi:hypothetical protein
MEGQSVLASRDDSNTDEVEHHPALAFDEMPEFIVALRAAQREVVTGRTERLSGVSA